MRARDHFRVAGDDELFRRDAGRELRQFLDRASVTSSSFDVRNTRGIVGSSTATRRIADSSNDWMITGIVFSDAAFSRPFFLIRSTNSFT